jgi:hypothetical protein
MSLISLPNWASVKLASLPECSVLYVVAPEAVYLLDVRERCCFLGVAGKPFDRRLAAEVEGGRITMGQPMWLLLPGHRDCVPSGKVLGIGIELPVWLSLGGSDGRPAVPGSQLA